MKAIEKREREECVCVYVSVQKCERYHIKVKELGVGK